VWGAESLVDLIGTANEVVHGRRGSRGYKKKPSDRIMRGFGKLDAPIPVMVTRDRSIHGGPIAVSD